VFSSNRRKREGNPDDLKLRIWRDYPKSFTVEPRDLDPVWSAGVGSFSTRPLHAFIRSFLPRTTSSITRMYHGFSVDGPGLNSTHQCWAGTRLQPWFIYGSWYQKNPTRLISPHAHSNLLPIPACEGLGTSGNTSLIPRLYPSQYQVDTYMSHTSPKSALDPNTKTMKI
jgi:hypothetical protein